MTVILRGSLSEMTGSQGYRKYRNKKVTIDGFPFGSKKEASRFQELWMMQKSGEIRDLEVHPKYEICVNGKKICNLVADFTYLISLRKTVPEGTIINIVWIDGKGFERIVEDVKAFDKKNQKFRTTEVYRLKKKLLLATKSIEVLET